MFPFTFTKKKWKKRKLEPCWPDTGNLGRLQADDRGEQAKFFWKEDKAVSWCNKRSDNMISINRVELKAGVSSKNNN